MGPSVHGTVTFCGLDSKCSPCSPEGLGSLSRCPALLLVPTEFAVKMSFFFFYHELLTSHIMTIIFMKQPKQRSLALEESRPYISPSCFPSAQALTRRRGFPSCPDLLQADETQATNPIRKE